MSDSCQITVTIAGAGGVAVIHGGLWPVFPLGDSLDVFIRREDAGSSRKFAATMLS